jgi:alcohol dehydrogenase (nicotinoprotein)
LKTRAAVVYEVGQPFVVEDLELDDPGQHEVLIRYEYAGLCHSDLHIPSGDIPARLPMVAGHEGAGVIEEVGPGVTRVKPGDHVVCAFVPSCGVCRWCATGQQALCDWGALATEGYLPPDRWPVSGPRGTYGAFCLLGTFSQYGVVHEASCVKVDDDLPLDKAVLVGCGVTTGWGSAVYAADVEPGDTIVIYGVGGIGINAVQGAAYAGARHVIAVDPLPNKLEMAGRLGATHTVTDSDQAQALIQELTHGAGADKAIVTAGVVKEPIVTAAFWATRKAGTIILTGLGGMEDNTIQLPGNIATLWKKTIRGSLFGDANPTWDIPKLLDLYRAGKLQLDPLITKTYTLDQVNEGYADLEAGRNIRGIIALEH